MPTFVSMRPQRARSRRAGRWIPNASVSRKTNHISNQEAPPAQLAAPVQEQERPAVRPPVVAKAAPPTARPAAQPLAVVGEGAALPLREPEGPPVSLGLPVAAVSAAATFPPRVARPPPGFAPRLAEETFGGQCASCAASARL